MGGLAALFERVLLDPELRARVDEDPAAVIDGFALSEEERAALREGGAAVLALLGRITPHPPAAAAVPPAPTPAALRPIALALDLRPFVDPADGTGAVRWAASLDPRADGPTPDGALRLRIDVHPWATGQAGELAVRARIGPVDAPPEPAPADGTWRLHPEAPGVVEALARARAAEGEGRVQALLDALDAMGAP